MKTNSIPAGCAVRARTITTPRHLRIRRAWLWTGFLAFAAIAIEPRPAQAAVTEAWVQRYGSETGSEDRAYKVVTDAAGNVIVAGTVLIKYSGAGVPLWTNRCDGGAREMAVDGSGNVFVTGPSATIAYSGAGVVLWANRYDWDVVNAVAVAVDGSGNAFVMGSSRGGIGGSDYATIKYSGAGVPLWTNLYNGPANSTDYAYALAVDASGNVFVTGASDSRPPGSGFRPSYDIATVAYSGAGVRLWTKRYNGYEPRAVAVDASGNVFVTGSSYGSGSLDYATIKYSGAGEPLWTNLYNGPGDTGDIPNALAVDASGNLFVTGYSAVGSGGHSDYATIAYSGAGVPLWTNRYNRTGNDWDVANAVAVDGSGNVFVMGSAGTIAYSGAGVPLWTNRYAGQAMAVDGNGNVFVTGNSAGSGGDSDYATIAYSGAGVPLWTNRYGGWGETWDIANAVAVDARGNVFVTGSSVGSRVDYVTIAYSGAGIALWTNRYGGPGSYENVANAMAVDGSGNVFVSGSLYGSGGNDDYVTIAYSGAGVPLWTNRYDGPGNSGDVPTAVAVDGSGNVFVTGSSGGDYATIAYSGAGVPLWTNRYDGLENGDDVANAVAVDGSGNVFVTGSSGGDYATIAYSSAGVPLWTNRYDGPGNSSDQAIAMAVGGSGNVFVTGTSGYPLGAWDYATIAYSGAGVPLWTNRYDGPNYSDQATAVAVDSSGNVFVTGTSVGSESYNDYATIAYSGAGVPLWTNRYQGPNGISHQATAVAVDGSGNVFVTGHSAGSDGNDDYATIAYSGAGVALWTNRYNGPGNGGDRPQTKSSLAIGSAGAVYVTGASDGLSSSDFITVKYVWRPEIAIQLLSTSPPKVNLTVSGAPNSSCAIERAPQLTGPWTNLSALVIGPNGSSQFQDTNPPYPAGFHRARQQ